MAGHTHEPLSVGEAKERVRSTGRELGVEGYLRRNPWQALALAALSGYVVGSNPRLSKDIAGDLAHAWIRILNSCRE